MVNRPSETSPRFDVLDQLSAVINETYSAEIWQAVKAGLATACALSVKGRTNPLAIIFEGPSGRGKSTIINMFAPDRPETKAYLYRLDGFTSKAFVSHAANKSAEELKDIDLLPKIKNKLLVTKELAPLFRNRDDVLRENFATVAAVLDGKGHVTASGVHGTRGYEVEHVFNWIGGTTPIPPRTDEIMAQLGNRLLRYEVIGETTSEDELIEFAASYTASDVDSKCKSLVNSFLAEHFKQHPAESLDLSGSFSKEHYRHLVNAAKLTAQGRIESYRIKDAQADKSDYVAGEPEGPQRVILLLRTFLAGLAMLESDGAVTPEALELVTHLAFSSIPMRRRKTLRALLTNGGKISTSALARTIAVTAPTAHDMMRELAATGLARFKSGSSRTPDTIVLAPSWEWLLADGAENEMHLCEEKSLET